MLSTDFRPGSPIWLDLGSTDLDTTTTFYTGLFDWAAESLGPEAGGYGFFTLDGKRIAGYGPLMLPHEPGAWTPYFGAPEVDAAVKAVEQAGGEVRSPAMDVMTAGRMAQVSDPTGGRFALWQSGDVNGFQTASVPGSLSWVELSTGDAPAALAFYRAALGWQVDTMEIGGGMEYHVVFAAGADPADAPGFGGIIGVPDRAALWQPYFEVADCDASAARATELGATLLIEPQTMPGVGRMSALSDPLGAQFSIIASEAPAA